MNFTEMFNELPPGTGGHPVQQFGEILSFDNPAYQGWSGESKITDLAAKCKEVNTKALKTIDARKEAKTANIAAKRAAFEEEKRRWRKDNGLKVNVGPPPKKSAEDIEEERMWMKEENQKDYEMRKNLRIRAKERRELDILEARGYQVME